MDFGWIATGVVGVAGAITTVVVQRSTTTAQTRREDARRADEHAHERRTLERDAVMRLVDTYQSAYRYARDFTHDFVMVRMPIPGWPTTEELSEVSTLEEAFGEWWRKH
ncbi:hypothetical protein, partial [Xanthomonas vasicola]|uniref:hypothetical protein n=1 Tax=Xanthomonas vasicola TaxID=56459 RepID=UPI000FF60E99